MDSVISGAMIFKLTCRIGEYTTQIYQPDKNNKETAATTEISIAYATAATTTKTTTVTTTVYVSTESHHATDKSRFNVEYF